MFEISCRQVLPVLISVIIAGATSSLDKGSSSPDVSMQKEPCHKFKDFGRIFEEYEDDVIHDVPLQRGRHSIRVAPIMENIKSTINTGVFVHEPSSTEDERPKKHPSRKPKIRCCVLHFGLVYLPAGCLRCQIKHVKKIPHDKDHPEYNIHPLETKSQNQLHKNNEFSRK